MKTEKVSYIIRNALHQELASTIRYKLLEYFREEPGHLIQNQKTESKVREEEITLIHAIKQRQQQHNVNKEHVHTQTTCITRSAV